MARDCRAHTSDILLRVQRAVMCVLKRMVTLCTAQKQTGRATVSVARPVGVWVRAFSARYAALT
jgi:hypothetical protein